MARLLAIESDSHEVRCVVARTKGPELTIEQLFSIAASSGTASATVDEKSLHAKTIESPKTVESKAQEADTKPEGRVESALLNDKILRELSARGLSKITTLVAIGRSNIELRQLSIPPAPPEDLPDMVRFQSLKQFPNIADDWPLDFVAMESNDPDSTNVLAAAMPSATMKAIQSALTTANLNATHMVLRPFAAAALLRRHSPDPSCRMMVDVVNDEADLTVLSNDQVVFMRTVRLPHDGDAEIQNRALLGEVRRTVVAAQNQLGGKRVERVVICDEGDNSVGLKKLLGDAISLPIEVIDPLANLEFDSGVTKPDRAGRFAPLIGMLLVEACETAHEIDFLNPKKRPVPPNRRRQQSIIAATVLTIVAGIAFVIWWQLADLDLEIKRRRVELVQLDRDAKEAEVNQTKLKAIEQFTKGDVGWLDELVSICEKLPPPEKAVLTGFQLRTSLRSLGELGFGGYASDSNLIKKFEDSVRDVDHKVIAGGSHYDPRQKDFPWQFSERIVIQDPEVVKLEAAKAEAERKAAVTGSLTSPKKSKKTKSEMD